MNHSYQTSSANVYSSIEVVTGHRPRGYLTRPVDCRPRTLISIDTKRNQNNNKDKTGTNKDLTLAPSIYLLNATSIAKPHGVEHLQADVIANDVQVVILTETWLKSKHPDEAYSLPGYFLFRRDRVKRKGGGVAIYVRNDLHATESSVCEIN